MTAKRFEYLGLGEYWDNQEDNELESKEVTELLNALNDENEQLKSRVDYLDRKIQRERTSFTKTHERWSKEAETKIKELAEENEQYKKNSISLKQLYKILEENKEHFLSLSECFSEKLFIKTIFRNIDEDIESMEEEE